MKYCLITPVLEAEIAEIRRKIMLSMNGITSEKMTQSGVVYKKNYGVAIPRIKEIASFYTPNSDLAQRLWIIGIRETMIIATLLQPVDRFTPVMANEWVDAIQQLELVEQTCMNLFSKLPMIFAHNGWIRVMYGNRLQGLYSLQECMIN